MMEVGGVMFQYIYYKYFFKSKKKTPHCTAPVSISQTARICVYYFKYEWFQFWLPSILLFLLINQDFKVGYDALKLNKDKYTLNMILNIERWIIILMFPVINVLKLIKSNVFTS